MTVLSRQNTTDGPAERVRTLPDAILRTVAYADVFDFALTAAEIHRYLIGAAAARAEISSLLAPGRGAVLGGRVSIVDGLVTLVDRESLAEQRLDRDRASSRLWPKAARYARAAGSLPFVRMVAVSGALAAGNATPADDIDLLIVTETDRLWLARAGAIALVRLVRMDGHELCPNHLLAESSLRLDEHDLYAASELARMVPIVGRSVYERMRALNEWTGRILPQAGGAPPGSARTLSPGWAPIRRVAEAALRTPAGAALERWERDRKVARFRARAASLLEGRAETSFSAERCKGHFISHRWRIRDAYEARCRRLGVEPLWELEDFAERAA